MMYQDIFKLHTCKTKRVSSYDKTGGNDDYMWIAAGDTAEIVDLNCCGVIRHIWMTVGGMEAFSRRDMILRIYWDGEENPSVQAPLGDFFGQGFGENYPFQSQLLAAAPAEGRGLCCYFSMPFQKNARISITNENDHAVSLYFYVDYEIHETLPADTAYFHAIWNREISAPHNHAEVQEDETGIQLKNQTNKHNYCIADIKGKGHFVGVQYYVDSPTPCWYGEGDDMFFIDGEPWPGSHHGTGTEDFFNSAWCPNELYAHPYFGYAKIPSKIGWLGRTHCYRFFLEDPICFEQSLNCSIEHGHANCLTLDLSTMAYWYQTEPHQPHPPMHPKEARQSLPPINHRHIHRWRQAWIHSMQDKERKPFYWGDES